jgi:hypothetical protein
MSGSDLTEADLSGANLSRALLSGADARLANLSGTSLIHAKLDDATMSGALLVQADLERAFLFHTNLSGADLTRANLDEANLTEADLSLADLRGASLANANLTRANLTGTKLSGANFTNATMGLTVFGNTDLSLVAGLDSTVHVGPSVIGIDTIYRSRGAIPENFLRRAGLPAQILPQLTELPRESAEIVLCFIVFSTEDQQFSERLSADLLGAGVSTWQLPADAGWSEWAWAEVNWVSRTYDKLVLVCSRSSLQNDRVLSEIDSALKVEVNERREIILPVVIDDYIFQSWEDISRDTIINRIVSDFREHDETGDTYEIALSNLIAKIKH